LLLAIEGYRVIDTVAGFIPQVCHGKSHGWSGIAGGVNGSFATWKKGYKQMEFCPQATRAAAQNVLDGYTAWAGERMADYGAIKDARNQLK